MRVKESVILGASLVLASLVFGMFFYSSRTSSDTIRVTGAATKSFESDIIKWKMSIVRNVSPSGVHDGYRFIAQDTDELVKQLAANGLDENDISIQPVNVQREYSQSGVTGYRIQRTVNVISRQVDIVERIALNPGEFIKKDLLFERSQLEFFYSGIDDLKKTLLADATKDARDRALEIAGSMGRSIKTIKTARAGVFQIREPFSNEVRDYGIYNSASRQKEITVTVHGEFIMN